MSDNDECPSRNFGESSQLTNWILESGATCDMTPEVSDLFQFCYSIWIHILKLWTYITSQRSNKDKFK